MRRELSGKVAVVTGASSGIGRATALRFARLVRRRYFEWKHAAPETPGNAFGPTGPEFETGGWRRPTSWGWRAAALAAAVAWVRPRA